MGDHSKFNNNFELETHLKTHLHTRKTQQYNGFNIELITEF